MSKLRTGLIGYGKLGKKRAALIKKHPAYELVAIADSEAAVIDYTDHKQMLEAEQLDCVFVCVPHTKSTQIVVDCLNEGLHVFTEKPPGICIGDVYKMKNAMSSKTILRFGFNHRFFSHIVAAKEVIDSKQLGKILWMRGAYGKKHLENWRTTEQLGGRGILISQGIHMVDLMRYLSGDEFPIVHSEVTLPVIGEPKIERNVMILMKSTNGITASIHSAAVMLKNTFELIIGFEHGYIKVCGLNTSTKSFGFPEQITVADARLPHWYGNPVETIQCFGIDNSWAAELDRFAHTIQSGSLEYDCSINDAEAVMKILEKVYNG